MTFVITGDEHIFNILGDYEVSNILTLLMIMHLQKKAKIFKKNSSKYMMKMVD